MSNECEREMSFFFDDKINNNKKKIERKHIFFSLNVLFRLYTLIFNGAENNIFLMVFLNVFSVIFYN